MVMGGSFGTATVLAPDGVPTYTSGHCGSEANRPKMGAGAGFARGDLQFMRLASCYCSTPHLKW